MFLGKCLTSQSANTPSWNKVINEDDRSNDTHLKYYYEDKLKEIMYVKIYSKQEIHF